MRTVPLLLAALACSNKTDTTSKSGTEVDTDVDIDADTDTDADADADADTDADTDTDADADTETGAEPTGETGIDPTGQTGDTGTGPTGQTGDTGVISTGQTGDTGVISTGQTGDTGATTLPLPGFGAISGACGLLDDTIWSGSSPLLVRNSIDFGSTVYDATLLTADGQEVIADGNLGGSSVESEAIAVEVLGRCELGSLLKTEGEILYLDSAGKKTDELLEIDGRKVGVSVTRALTFVAVGNLCGAPDPVDIEALLTDKLSDLPLSAANADPADAWERSMLSVIACDSAHGDAVEAAWAALDPAILGDFILMLTVTEGEDGFIY